MTAVVIDTGPLVAWLNRRDQHHRWSVQILDTVEVPLITCEPVLSEACFLLSTWCMGSFSCVLRERPNRSLMCLRILPNAWSDNRAANDMLQNRERLPTVTKP